VHPEAEEIIRRLSLAPHPEGGFYRETWRSPLRVATSRGERAALTLIHYLLPAGSFSALHRVLSDEAWQHAAGDPLELIAVDPAGRRTVHRIGPGSDAGVVPHAVVPASSWQAARPLGDRYALLGCAVAPGFEFADLEFLGPDELLRMGPHLADLSALARRPT